MNRLRGVLAIAGLTWREAARARLWWLVLAGLAITITAVPRLGAVDAGDRLKLAVVFTSSLTGFIALLAGILLTGSMLRRDREARLLATLWAKPVSRLTWLGGRCLGVWLLLAAMTAILSLGALLAIRWQLGALPIAHAVTPASSWWQLRGEQAQPIAADFAQIRLHGDPRRSLGNAVRWQFNNVSSSAKVALRTRLSAGAVPPEWTTVLIQAAPSPAGPWQHLNLAEESPYGWGEDGAASANQRIRLRSRTDSFRDVQQDYAHLMIPDSAINDQQQMWLQVVRLDADIAQLWHRDHGAVLIAAEGGFTSNMMRAQLMLLARAAVLIALAAWLAGLAQLGVVLLGSLAVLLAGSGLTLVREGLGQAESPGARLLQLIMGAVPDFAAYQTDALLAASRTVPWAMVGEAWAYYLIFTAIFATLAWLTWHRSEL